MSKFIGVKMIEAVPEKAYYKLEDPAGDILRKDDIKRFISNIESIKVGTKTTNTTLTCLTGFVLQWAKYGLKK
jgi:hypothetical protein